MVNFITQAYLSDDANECPPGTVIQNRFWAYSERYSMT